MATPPPPEEEGEDLLSGEREAVDSSFCCFLMLARICAKTGVLLLPAATTPPSVAAVVVAPPPSSTDEVGVAELPVAEHCCLPVAMADPPGSVVVVEDFVTPSDDDALATPSEDPEREEGGEGEGADNFPNLEARLLMSRPLLEPMATPTVAPGGGVAMAGMLPPPRLICETLAPLSFTGATALVPLLLLP